MGEEMVRKKAKLTDIAVMQVGFLGEGFNDQ